VSKSGDIIASNFVNIGSSAKVIGNIQTPKLSINNGAYIDGKITMFSYYKDINSTNFFE